MELHQHVPSASPAPMTPSSLAVPADQSVFRAARSGWSEAETQLLWERVRAAAAQGAPLREVFESVAAALGRKPNSIRNYYYAQLKERDEPELKRALPFETFTDDQIRDLVRTVLQKKGEGMSVRACVTQMAQGDKALMLRYQNKYRSTLRGRPDLVREVMQALQSEGLPCADPYMEKKACLPPDEMLSQATQRVRRMGDPALFKMLEGMNTLLERAMKNEETAQQTESSVSGAGALNRALLERDRLSARNDLLRIALEDEEKKNEALAAQYAQLVGAIRDFVSQSDLARAQHIGDFCQTLTAQLAALESAAPAAH